MAVLEIGRYKQQDGEDILVVNLSPTRKYCGYFYCNASDEDLVKKYDWCYLKKLDYFYIEAVDPSYKMCAKRILFHKVKTLAPHRYREYKVFHNNGVF